MLMLVFRKFGAKEIGRRGILVISSGAMDLCTGRRWLQIAWSVPGWEESSASWCAGGQVVFWARITA